MSIKTEKKASISVMAILVIVTLIFAISSHNLSPCGDKTIYGFAAAALGTLTFLTAWGYIKKFVH
jgi:hypothetical protein